MLIYTKLTIRYGRIGDTGQTQSKTYTTPEKAQAEAKKKFMLGLAIKRFIPLVKKVNPVQFTNVMMLSTPALQL